MFGLFRKGPLLDEELAGWQYDCFEWLLRQTGGLEAFHRYRLIPPTPQYFPHDGSRGHAFAEMIFNQVRAHAGMADWPCALECQESDPNTMVSPQAFVKDAPSSPAGTFRMRKESGGALITYNPDSLHNPMSLVATFAHELAHYRMAAFDEPPPGGWEVHEPATDLFAVFMGFGIFLANSRFNFSHFNDGKVAGWRTQHQGYLSEAEILHMHAVCSVTLSIGQRETLPHLKSALRGIFKRAYKDVTARSVTLRQRSEVAIVAPQVS